jgi:hypothetical protein
MMTDNTTCPTCGKKGHNVDGATVKSMLAVSLRYIQNIPYRFCTTSDCEVVYYSDDGDSTFTTHQVRERVYQKEAEADDVLICYCFQHTPADIHQKFEQANHKTIIDDINAGIQAGQCACDWRNPQGNCCLGNVRQFIKRLEAVTITSDGE